MSGRASPRRADAGAVYEMQGPPACSVTSSSSRAVVLGSTRSAQAAVGVIRCVATARKSRLLSASIVRGVSGYVTAMFTPET